MVCCAGPGGRPPEPTRLLLGVILDDQLLLDQRVDLAPGWQRVHQDAHLVRDHLEPRRNRALARLGARDHERGELVGLGRDLDDVALADPERRDVHLAPVDQNVPVPDDLAGHVPALRETGPVDHVVQAPLQHLQQGLAGPAAGAGGFLVVVVELPLEDPVDPLGLLLLPDLEQVVVLLGPVAAVLTRRVGPDLDGALRRVALGALQEQLGLLAAAALAVGAGVSSHCWFSPSTPGAAWAGGSHCAEPGGRPGSSRPPGRSPGATGWRSPGPSPDPSRTRQPCACRAPWPGGRRPQRPSARRTAWTCASP